MNDRFNEIPARIDQTLATLSRLSQRLDNFETSILPKIGKTEDSVLIPVQILESGYTAAETLFLRISQAFENSLDDNRWHTDLLEKMKLEIKDVRPQVISDITFSKLSEILRFRHFKRYYFEMDFDWRKIELLVQIFREAIDLLSTDMQQFRAYISQALQ